jgi:predicted small integral membrane protein
LGFLLYGLGFLVIGGEWFAMWQSEQWNGQDAAFRFLVTISAVLIILLLPDRNA